MGDNLLIVGAQHGSIGWSIAQSTKDTHNVTTAGLHGHQPHGEDVYLDVLDAAIVHDVIVSGEFHHVVVTVGINEETTLERNGASAGSDFIQSLERQNEVNYLGPMRILEHWYNYWMRQQDMTVDPMHFVVISSNSAHVPRSTGHGYCASKAALSMAIRCAAREIGGDQFAIYGYEPQVVQGTPMTTEVAKRLAKVDPKLPLLRSGATPLARSDLAEMVKANLMAGVGVNGSMFTIGDER